MDITALIQQSNSWFDFKTKIDALPKKQMGNAFELLTKLYFKINPVYSAYDEVWLLSEVPSKVFEYLGLPSHDLGIDLIAKQGDEYHPIQCKYHSEKNSSITFNEVATFISLLEGNDKFTQGYICSTANVTSKNLDKIKNKPINQILSDKWVQLDEDFFDMIRNYFNNKKYIPTAYIPMEHQVKALKEAVTYFIDGKNARGKLIFPCGAGKSLTGFWMTQALESTATLIAVPSLSLVKQTLDVYLREIVARGIKVKWLCICSDEGIGKDDEVMENTESLGIPCQTNPEYIEKWLETNRDEHKIIFTTYQSGRIIADVSKKLKLSFDVGIFDEAHKTVGLNKKLFSYLLFDDNIAIAKRIFMTATERFYSGTKEDIISMDDYEIYGDTFSQMSFKEAIEKELLTNYKIITIDVKKSEIAEFIKSNNLVQLSNKWKNETEARSLAAMIALRKAMKVLPIKNAVSFHSSIDKAQRNKDLQSYISSSYDFEPIDSFTVSSKVATTKRNDIIREFADSKRALITNAKCLTEGVDVPNIDCIVFADPRKSKVDIVQALGRALRKKKGKQWGYVILPVLYDDATHEIDNDNYNEIISIVRGLAANDERIVEYFKEKNDNAPTQRKEGSNVFDFNFSSDLLDEKALSEQLQIKIWEGLSRFNWMAFEEAREYVRGLGFNNVNEWSSFAKSREKPNNIPKHPIDVYKKLWTSFSDWLGTNRIANIDKEFINFEDAKKYAWNLNLKSVQEWNLYRRSNSKPDWLPSNPNIVYKNEGWLSWSDWFGTKKGFNGLYLNFEEARNFVRRLNLNSQKDWKEYIKSKNKPNNIPSYPNSVYFDKGWKGFGDWLGTGKRTNFNREYKSFEEARKFVHSLNLKTFEEWSLFRKSNSLPIDIPTNPNIVYYSSGWKGIKDWLGTEILFDFLDFENARTFIHSLGFEFIEEWKIYSKSENKPSNIPVNPNIIYKNCGWVNFYDWIGIESLSTKKEKYLTFEIAREFAIGLNLSNQSEWFNYIKGDNVPEYLPAYPSKFYKNIGWVTWGDWLGTNIIANQNKEFLVFDDARLFAHSLKLNSANQWKEYCKSGNKPFNIPSIPENTYKNKGWVSYADWLNTNNIQSGKINYREFKQAREFVRKLKFKSNNEWNDYAKSDSKPNDIPATPMSTYKNKGWLNMGDWLGNNRVAYGSINYLNFEDVKIFVRKLNINSRKEWDEYCLSGSKPTNIPKTLHYTYKSEWKGWDDFLGK